jgi:hypothetical protein
MKWPITMPIIARTFLKTSLIFFVVALLAGVTVMARPLLELPRFVNGLAPVYFHLFMVGWVTQLIVGVAHWMFPKFSRTQPRGHDALAWMTYGFLNAGLLLRVIAEPAHAVSAAVGWGWLLAFSALFQWIAGICFVLNTWPRVKEK